MSNIRYINNKSKVKTVIPLPFILLYSPFVWVFKVNVAHHAMFADSFSFICAHLNWIKLAEWGFLEKNIFFIVVNIFLQFCFYISLEDEKVLWQFATKMTTIANIQRARATNGKYGLVDLSKNENHWEGRKEWLFSK